MKQEVRVKAVFYDEGRRCWQRALVSDRGGTNLARRFKMKLITTPRDAFDELLRTSLTGGPN